MLIITLVLCIIALVSFNVTLQIYKREATPFKEHILIKYIYCIIQYCMVAPITEEYIFRSLIILYIGGIWNDIIFGLSHMINYNKNKRVIVYQVISCIYLGYYLRQFSYIQRVIIHMLYNMFITVGSIYYFECMYNNMGNIIVFNKNGRPVCIYKHKLPKDLIKSFEIYDTIVAKRQLRDK
jgi:membrane protease YdiL (CAAX protease family)